VGVTGSAFLGLTLSCARCHDHKYDPLPIKDYYRLEAFFAPTVVALEPLAFGQYELPSQEPRRWEAQKKAWFEMLDAREKWQNETLEKYKNRLREQPRVLASSADIKDLLADPADDLPKAMAEGLLFSEEEQMTYKQIGRQTARFANPNTKDYYEAKAYLVKDSPLHRSVATHVLGGGSYKLKTELVEPGFLSAVTGDDEPVNMTGLSGKRRKLLAEPKTSYVAVSRLRDSRIQSGPTLRPVHPRAAGWRRISGLRCRGQAGTGFLASMGSRRTDGGGIISTGLLE